MALSATKTVVLREVESDEFELCDSAKEAGPKEPEKHQFQYFWRYIILYIHVHIGTLYATYLIFASAKIYTTIFAILCHYIGILGITAGAHRLWAHRCYKAKWPLRLFLVILNTLDFQSSVIVWARYHRAHHKFSDTDADPHNSKRGFLFSHFGWILVHEHPQVTEKSKQIDMSDLYADPILRFQDKYYYYLVALTCFFIPTLIPWYFWSETLHNAYFVGAVWRYCISVNLTGLVNSAAHMWGSRPYDKTIRPTQLWLLSLVVNGEGWHNYHHAFPWDYKAAEFGAWTHNLAASFIDLCAKLGLAYDLKTVSPEMVKRRVERTGDGTHELWGWGDKDQSQEERNSAIILNRK